MTSPSTKTPTTPTSKELRDNQRIVRFDRFERTAHWLTATLFIVLMLTALPLYFGSIEGVVGRRILVQNIHTWCGLALPIPLIVLLCGPWGAMLRRDMQRFNQWTKEELRWLRTLGQSGLRAADKFNPGQKFNAIFTGGAIVVMLATGSVLKWFRHFPLAWRTGATFVHDVFALAIFIVVIGHITFALTHREALRSMLKGWVTRKWAAKHAGAWLKEQPLD